jgi:nitrite transporter NirC
MGASFAVALSLVIFAGSELFTGNNMIMLIGNLEKQIPWKTIWGIWGVRFVGNLVGSLLLALMLVGTGLVSGPIIDFLLEKTATKMNAPFLELFLRGILGNMLVCLAIWSGANPKMIRRG